MFPLGFIFDKYNILYHCYADDTQFYLPTTPESACSLANLLNCLEDVKCWMARNFLELNDNKTEVILFAPPSLVTRMSNALGPLAANLHSVVKTLAVFFFNKQVGSVVNVSFYQLRTKAKLKPFLLA